MAVNVNSIDEIQANLSNAPGLKRLTQQKADVLAAKWAAKVKASVDQKMAAGGGPSNHHSIYNTPIMTSPYSAEATVEYEDFPSTTILKGRGAIARWTGTLNVMALFERGWKVSADIWFKNQYRMGHFPGTKAMEETVNELSAAAAAEGVTLTLESS